MRTTPKETLFGSVPLKSDAAAFAVWAVIVGLIAEILRNIARGPPGPSPQGVMAARSSKLLSELINVQA